MRGRGKKKGSGSEGTDKEMERVKGEGKLSVRGKGYEKVDVEEGKRRR